MNAFSCLYLGYQLHYFEDYFTFPHNTTFHGTITEHIMYEHELTEYIIKNLSEKKELWEKEEEVLTFSELEIYLKELHHVYLQEKMGFNIERLYITEAAKNVVYCFATILGKNKRFYEQAIYTALQIAPQNSYYFQGMEGNI